VTGTLTYSDISAVAQSLLSVIYPFIAFAGAFILIGIVLAVLNFGGRSSSSLSDSSSSMPSSRLNGITSARGFGATSARAYSSDTMYSHSDIESSVSSDSSADDSSRFVYGLDGDKRYRVDTVSGEIVDMDDISDET